MAVILNDTDPYARYSPQVAQHERHMRQRERLAENTLTAAYIAAFEYLTPGQVVECLMRASERWPRRVRALESIIVDFEGDPND